MQYHIPALLNESIEGLNIRSDGIYVDVTFGGGGHSKEILKFLKSGRLIAFDQDIDAFKNKPEDDRFLLIHGNFRYIKNYLRYNHIEKVDGILADLGVSSHHFDEKSRGFSFSANALLDMRMNKEMDTTAADIINNYDEDNLKRIFRNYGELFNAHKIAHKIVQFRKFHKIKTIEELVQLVKMEFPKKKENKFLAMLFQALRIELNDEIGALTKLLEVSNYLLNKNGRFVVISYHSLEDRLVKNFFKTGNMEGNLEKDFYGNVIKPFKLINKRVIVASEDELKVNNRARSAKLRIAEKL